MLQKTIARMRGSSAEFRRVAWSYPDELRSLRGHQAVVEAARLVSRHGAFKPALEQQEKRLSELGLRKESESRNSLFEPNDWDMSSTFSSSIPSLQSFLERTMTAAHWIVTLRSEDCQFIL